MTNFDRTPDYQLNTEKKKPSLGQKLAARAIRSVAELAFKTAVGKDNKKMFDFLARGLSEDAIISPRLCYPSSEVGNLIYQQAHAGQWLGYDIRRTEFYPDVEKYQDKMPGVIDSAKEHEGSLSALILDGIGDKPQDERTVIPYHEYFSLDNLMNFDKPKLETLVELGMLARRSHELAYEIAGAEEWIDGLRSRGVADDLVYQVTPKAHTLIILTPDGGRKTPKKERQPALERVPGILAH